MEICKKYFLQEFMIYGKDFLKKKDENKVTHLTQLVHLWVLM